MIDEVEMISNAVANKMLSFGPSTHLVSKGYALTVVSIHHRTVQQVIVDW